MDCYNCGNQLICEHCGNPETRAQNFEESGDLFLGAIRAKPRTLTIEEVRKAFDKALQRF